MRRPTVLAIEVTFAYSDEGTVAVYLRLPNDRESDSLRLAETLASVLDDAETKAKFEAFVESAVTAFVRDATGVKVVGTTTVKGPVQ